MIMKMETEYDRETLRSELSAQLLDELAARIEDHIFKAVKARGDTHCTKHDKSRAVQEITKQIFGT